MKVVELIERLTAFPSDMDVQINYETYAARSIETVVIRAETDNTRVLIVAEDN
jgi:hypothetical protein